MSAGLGLFIGNSDDGTGFASRKSKTIEERSGIESGFSGGICMATISLRNTFQYLKFGRPVEDLDERAFGKKLGLLTKLIGCSHERISRPFGEGKASYRSCLSCGARKPFDPETLETSKTFYCAPVVRV